MKKFLACVRQAIHPAVKSASWLLQLMIPISLAVTLLQRYGILSWLASYLNSLFVHLGLPGSSALVFISGASAGTYSGIAAMMSMPLTMREATILGISYGAAVMVELEKKGIISREDANIVNYHLIMSHSMLEDTLVFAATGISAFWIISTRLLFALVVVWGRHGVLHIIHAPKAQR
ncbi:MAG: hypothetical protein Q4E55_06085 [Bacteroidales bacterium]|nr:hypothetical protein [Bacteroidales bacterium]